MILVTGGTGFIGSHLLLYLVRKGEKVRALYRNTNSIAKTKHLFEIYSSEVENLFNTIEWVQADITDISQLEMVFKNITHIYHTAALVSFNKKNNALMHLTNVEGTANMVNLAVEYHVKKFVHLSSIAALGSYDTPITEKTHWNWKEKHSEYGVTKYLSEMEVWRASQEGLNTVILNPSVVLGAGFWKESSGSIFTKVDQGISFYTSGTTGFVDVWDVVKSMYQVMNSNTSVTSFIISAYNISYKTLLDSIAKKLNKKQPKLLLPKWILQLLIPFESFRSSITKQTPLITSDILQSLYSYTEYSGHKYSNEFNFKYIPFEASISNIAAQYKKSKKK